MTKLGRRVVELLALACCAVAPAAQAAGTLYVALHDSAPSERLASVTPATAALALLGSGVANCCGVSDASTLDAAGNVFYFVGVTTADPTTPRLFQFDTTDGSELAASGVALPDTNSYNVLEWDPATSSLYAFVRPTATTTEQLVRIDTTTGALTNVGSAIADCCQFQGGASALGAGRLLFFGAMTTDPAGTARLFSIDLATGTIASNPTLDGNTSYADVAFDPDSGTVYGMAHVTATGAEEVVSIDAATGAVTAIGGATAGCCFRSGTGTYDSASNTLYFTGGLTADGMAGRLMAFSTASGALVSSPSWPVGNNYNFLEFDLVPPAQLTATKTVAGDFHEGGAITYTVTVHNVGTGAQGDNPGHELTDALPPDLSLVSAAATSGAAATAANTVTWDGALAPGASVTLTIQATIHAGTPGHLVQNQATLAYDGDADGTNETGALSDDPGAGGAADATGFTVLALPAIAVPALSPAGLGLVALALAGAAVGVLRRRARPGP